MRPLIILLALSPLATEYRLDRSVLVDFSGASRIEAAALAADGGIRLGGTIKTTAPADENGVIHVLPQEFAARLSPDGRLAYKINLGQLLSSWATAATAGGQARECLVGGAEREQPGALIRAFVSKISADGSVDFRYVVPTEGG